MSDQKSEAKQPLRDQKKKTKNKKQKKKKNLKLVMANLFITH